MITFGSTALLAGFLFALAAVLAGAYGAWNGERRAVDTAERGVLVAAALAWMAAAVLVALMLNRDYRVAYVWEYTSNTLPAAYAVTALWAGQAGSLLWWLCLLGATAAVAARTTLRARSDCGGNSDHASFDLIRPWALVVLALIMAFFFSLVLWAADPFQLLADKYPAALGHSPHDGQGLNPQLQNFGMIIHPPLLYLGYILFSVPFALALASLCGDHPAGLWVKRARPWTMAAWTILGFGILCGMKWAYVELGWGGYWAWDPVENASLMPWLTGTALLHSAMVEERLGALRRWNYLLVVMTFLLSVFGTFLTRSGILSSVHAFAQSDVGPYFMNFFAAWTAISAGLLALRWSRIAPSRPLSGILSREALFLFQNLLLVGLAAAVFWGTMYPIVSEKMTGEKVTVAAPYYDQVAVPLGLAIYILMGAAPLIPWRGANPRRFLTLSAPPFVLALVAGLAQRLLLGGSILAASGTAIAIFSLAVLAYDLQLAGAARRRAGSRDNVESWPLAIAHVLDRQHRRYGGFLAHAGMAVLMIGLAGAGFNRQSEARLAPGDKLDLAPWSLELTGSGMGNDGHRDFARAELTLRENGKPIEVVRPEISIYFPGQEREQRNTEVSILSSPLRDLYVIFVEPDGEHAVIRLMVHPLVLAVWAGGFVTVLGALFALLPNGLLLGLFQPAAARVLHCSGCGAREIGERFCWNCGASKG